MRSLFSRDRRSKNSSRNAKRRRNYFLPQLQQLEDRRLLAAIVTGRIWIDADYDGQQDAAETQTANVNVSLMQNGSVVAQAATVNGTYTFNNVTANTTTHLKFNLPANFTLGPTDTGSDATDNDFSVTSTFGATVAEKNFLQVGEGQTVRVDGGIVQGANLTVFAWKDADGDGIQDAGAPEATGLASVDAELRSVAPFNYAGSGVFTAANGIAHFNNVRPGNYTLTFSHSTLVRTLKDQGGNDALDSDADPSLGTTIAFALTPGSTRTDMDVGFRDPALVTGKITGRAWLDNGDGIRQTNETTLTGVHVMSLYRSTDTTVGNADDTFVNSAATDATQNYQLTGLNPGNYYVRSVVPTNHIITLQNQGTNDTIDSDFLPATQNSGLLVLAAGATIANVDVGFLPGKGTIGNFIWNDVDRDGIQDATETGLAGATVKLFNATNTLVGSAITTTTTGSYLFTGLQPGNYTVRVTPPLGYLPSPKDQGVDDTKDSDMDLTTLSTPVITLAAGASQTQWDMGMFLGAKVGDKVWVDSDQDGFQDTTELGKQGVIVRLKSVGLDGNAGTTDDVDVAQTGTNATGNYEFVGVNDGIYYVQFSAPVGFAFTKRDVGSDLTDSDAGITNGRTAKFKIVNFANNVTLDAGLVPVGSLYVHVGPDKNDDGFLEPGGIPGAEVWVYDPGNGVVHDRDDVFIVKGVTNAAGDIAFPGLKPRSYYVRIFLPGGYEFSPPNQTSVETIDSDVTHFCDGYGNTGIVLVSPSLATSVTAGLVQLPGAIEGVVWNDANRNRIRDGALLQGAAPDVILALDISGSTTERYPGSAIGDVNGDGWADTFLDAEILSGISLVQQLNNAGLGPLTRIGIVTYNSTAQIVDMDPALSGVQTFLQANVNADADSFLDVIEALKGIRSVGGEANYEAALQAALTVQSIMATPGGRGNLLFFSDGPPTRGGSFSDEVTTLRSKQVNLRAFGLGGHDSLTSLQSIDPNAKVYEEVDDFYAALQLNNGSTFAKEQGMADVQLYLDLDKDGVWDVNEPKVLSLDDDPDTSTIDETGTYRFDNVAPGSYVLREVIPTGYTQTHPGTPGFGWAVTVAAGKTQRNADFGNAAAPNLTGLPVSVSFKAGTAETLLSVAAIVTDLDTPVLNTGVLSVRITNGQATDKLMISHQGTATGQIGVSGTLVYYGNTVIGSFTGGTATTALAITLNSHATLAAVQALARRISFRSTLAVPSTLSRSVEWKLTDGLGGSVIKTETVTIA